MSAWRLLAQELHRHGPRYGNTADSGALERAKALGLVEHNDRRQWCLTPLGVDWCEGRVVLSQQRPGGHRWAATWLRALPRGSVGFGVDSPTAAL